MLRKIMKKPTVYKGYVTDVSGHLLNRPCGQKESQQTLFLGNSVQLLALSGSVGKLLIFRQLHGGRRFNQWR
ncbi:MAG: hypothetical protein ACI9ON_000125 [Limisphaerales bacterium]|jgi:hypothetical protein